ncbi:hypothetical protein ACERK3_16200 [Phycisphaerales bacterium AB-hyl4]|uniref:Uncharacterized protein n=1 Tax=Natronomicrosphaera hydrolytica TaxID=3242702 RepID=A0ABV4U8G5_9BACT
MAKAGRRGRPSRPYRTSWGENVEGLYKCPDGRWRITVTGQTFTEHDERREHHDLWAHNLMRDQLLANLKLDEDMKKRVEERRRRANEPVD